MIENPIALLMLILFCFSLVGIPFAIFRRQWDSALPCLVALCGYTFIGVMSSLHDLYFIALLLGTPFLAFQIW